MSPLLEDPTFWVAVGTVLFIALIVWRRVPQMIGKLLDERAASIKAELEEARRLREEAEVLLKQYRAKTAGAEQEAKAVIDAAKEAADRMAIEARAQLQQQLERRAKMAEEKIAQAEADAVAEVRAVATAVATSAAAEVIGKRVTDAKGDELIESAIRDLRTKLH